MSTSPKKWKIRNSEISLAQPKIMGILNVTPDSFSDGGRYFRPEDAIARAFQIEKEGADILDIGAESTRPGAQAVTAEQEWQRLEPVLLNLSGRLKIPISVDTRHGELAHRALDAGVAIVNDVSNGADPALLRMVAKTGAGYILMHSRGESAHMMELAHYQDVVVEVKAELQSALQRALDAGIASERICIDPGFGFAKTPEHNYRLLKELNALSALGYPLLVGLSRKRMLREIVGSEESNLSIASVVAGILAIERGANILRVHEVAATRVALQVIQTLTLSI